jgi:hypothetical protein
VSGIFISYLYSRLMYSISAISYNAIDREIPSISEFFYHLHILMGIFYFLIAEIEITKSVHSLSNFCLLYLVLMLLISRS